MRLRAIALGLGLALAAAAVGSGCDDGADGTTGIRNAGTFQGIVGGTETGYDTFKGVVGIYYSLGEIGRAHV